MLKQYISAAGLIGMCILMCTSALGAEVKGIITARAGETLLVKSRSGTVTVVLTDSTRTKDDKGLFGLQKEELSNAVLIPGLKVDIDGRSDRPGVFIAETITVDGDDLETAEMIQSGLHPTAQQVAANMRTLQTHQQSIESAEQHIAGNRSDINAAKQGITANKQQIAASEQKIAANKEQIDQNIKEIEEATNRFSRLDDYDVKGQSTVRFNVSSSTLSPEAMEELKQLAQTATGISGYIVEVIGFTDSTGRALMNEQLSEDRAKRVVAFLVQQCNIPVRRIVAPGAMGEYQPTAPNETAQGRAENRRVEVKILVNKGLAR